MKYFSVILIILTTAALFAGTQNVNQEGLQITVTERKLQVEGLVDFAIEVKNTTTEPRTLTGKIAIIKPARPAPVQPALKPGQKPTDTSAQLAAEESDPDSCAVFLEIPAGQTVQQVFPCIGRGYTGWQFSVTKIYNIIVEN